ncbi:hypothetical protein [Roseibium sp. SCP14]|uniref:hypothetical protein n=1 Tax=Roseibium sp. SCP14 TaxID=3141375 RepID=UPI0033364C31
MQAETSKTPLFALQCGGSALQISIDELETVRARFATALKVRGINPEASDFFSENFFAQVSCKLKNGFGGQNLTEGQLEKVDILELLINAPRSRGKSEAVLDILELLQQTKDQQKTK